LEIFVRLNGLIILVDCIGEMTKILDIEGDIGGGETNSMLELSQNWGEGLIQGMNDDSWKDVIEDVRFNKLIEIRTELYVSEESDLVLTSFR
jgi:hypothetical protein